MGRESLPLGQLSHYNDGERLPRDRPWLVVFGLLWAVCLAGSVVGGYYSHPYAARVQEATAAECPYPDGPSHPGRRLLGALGADHTSKSLVGPIFTCLLLSLLCALLAGWSYLYLFQHHAGRMVKASIGIQIVLPFVLGIVSLASLAGNDNDDSKADEVWNGVLFFVVLFFVWGACMCLFYWCWRDQVPLAANLLRVSANGLAANRALIPTAAALSLVGMLATMPLMHMAYLVLQVGSLAPNPLRDGRPDCTSPSFSLDPDLSHPVTCCVFQPSTGSVLFVSLVWMPTFVWTVLLAYSTRVYVVAGTIAQWYFAPADNPDSTRGTTVRAMKQALGPSLGTICFGAAIITLTRFVKSLADRLQRRFWLLGWLIAFPLRLLAELLEYLTTFALCMAAITGESLAVAGRRSTDLLRRNMLEAWASTIWFVPLTVRLTALVLSAGWGYAGALSFSAYSQVKGYGSLGGLHVAVGVFSSLMCLGVLAYFGGILLNVLDAVFLCWALDKDANTISKQEVWEVFSAVPLKPATGAVVQQPGGDMSYGAEVAMTPATGAAPRANADGEVADEQQQQLQPLLGLV